MMWTICLHCASNIKTALSDMSEEIFDSFSRLNLRFFFIQFHLWVVLKLILSLFVKYWFFNEFKIRRECWGRVVAIIEKYSSKKASKIRHVFKDLKNLCDFCALIVEGTTAALATEDVSGIFSREVTFVYKMWCQKRETRSLFSWALQRLYWFPFIALHHKIQWKSHFVLTETSGGS